MFPSRCSPAAPSPTTAYFQSLFGIGLKTRKWNVVITNIKYRKMKKTKNILLALGLLAVINMGCTTNQQKIAYNSLYTTEKTTTTTFDVYVSQGIRASATGPTMLTNNLPAIARAYNLFQAGFKIALDAAQYNTNALAPASLQVESTDILNMINQAKGGK